MVTMYNPFEGIRGGIESVAYELSKAFAKLKHETWILTMGDVNKKTIADVQGVNLWILPDRKMNNLLARSLFFIKEGKSIIEKMEKELEVDVFNGQAGLAVPLFFASLKKAKRIITVHTVDAENIAKIRDCWRVRRYREFAGESLRYPILKLWRSFFFWKSDALVFVSSFAMNEFKLYYPHLGYKPSFVIENGFPEQGHIHNTSCNRNYDFVYVGRIDKIKGVDLIVKATRLLRDKYSPKIAVAGDGAWKKTTEQLASRLGVTKNIHFLGHLPHSSVLELVGAATCVVIPSFYESDPLVMKECLALNVPIISSDISSLKQGISDNENRWAFRCGDHQDLAKTMERFLSSHALMGSRSRGNMGVCLNSEFNSWESAAKRYVRVFESLSKS